MRIIRLAFWTVAIAIAILAWIIMFVISRDEFRNGLIIGGIGAAVLSAIVNITLHRRRHAKALADAAEVARAANPALFGNILRQEDLPK